MARCVSSPGITCNLHHAILNTRRTSVSTKGKACGAPPPQIIRRFQESFIRPA